MKSGHVHQIDGHQTLASVAQPFVFALGLLTGLLIVINRGDLLPNYFRFDSDKIQLVVSGYSYGDSSFDPVGAVYRSLGIIESPLLAGLVGYGIFAVALLIVYARNARAAASWYVTTVFAVAAILGGVYLGGYSKDVFVLPIVFLAMLLPKGIGWDAIIVGSMLIYAAEFRSYWTLVAAIYVIFRIVLPRARRLRYLIAWLLFASVIVSLVIYFALGAPPDAYRSVVNESRGQVAINTVIEPFFDGPQPVSGIINNALTLAALIVPLPLARLGGVYYLVLATMIFVIWIGFLLAARRTIRSRDSTYRGKITIGRCIAMVLAFLTVQAAFEPDYGSALRHLVPLVPAMLMVAFGSNRQPSSEIAPISSQFTEHNER